MSATELLSNYDWSGWWEKPKRRQKKNNNSFAGHCSCVVAHIADIWYVTSPSTTSTTCWAAFPFKSLSRVCGRTSSCFFFLLLLFVFVSRCFRLLVRFFEASLGFFLLGSYFLKSFIRKIPLRLFSKLSGYFEIPEFRTRISMRFLWGLIVNSY